MADVTTLGPPGPNFWTFLVVIPTLAATGTGAITKSPSMAAEAYILSCLGLASLQAPCYDWWMVHVEGYLGMPRWVHIGAGVAELIIVALRILSYYPMIDDDSSIVMMATATVLTCGLMGGAFWTWFVAVNAPHCFVPAALLLLATLANQPVYEQQLQQTVSWAMTGSFVIGAGVAALVHQHHRRRNSDDKRKAHGE
jgi:hypothetical protein